MPQPTISHYELLEPIGRGGMGVVHKARDINLGRFAALKFLSPDLVGSSDARDRFLREARSLSSLSHPHIATIYEVGEADGKPFLAMELLSGGTLRSRVAAATLSGAPIPEGQVLDWAIGLGEGLAHAHGKGIVHRDVKCSNAMFDEEGRIKLTDFGLAKSTEGADASASASVVGTVEYMSPEQLSGGVVDQRSDLFSLGVVLYEMTTGQLPFSGSTHLELANKIVSADAPRVSTIRPAVAPALDHVVARLLSKSPADRYPTAGDALRDLALVRSGVVDPSQLPTESLPQVKPARRYRKRTLAAVALAAIVILIVFLRPAPPVLPEHKHVLVLPFRSIGGDANQEALCDGLTETLTTALTQTGLLSVVPTSDARKIETVQQARKEFGVNLVLTGSLQRRGDQVRLTLSLVDADKQAQLGAETVDASAAQPFQVDEGMLAKAADLIDVAVPQANAGDAARAVSSTPGAFDAYLRGRGFLYRYDKAGNLERALQQFEEAIGYDPEFALAYTGIAESQLRIYRGRREPRDLVAARAASERALSLNPGAAGAHVIYGAVLAEAGERDSAVVELERAIEIDPKDPAAYRELAGVYGKLGKQDKAEAVNKKAILARPGDWRSYANLGSFYFGQQRYDEAELLYRKVIAIAPDNHFGYRNLGGLLATTGQNDEAEKMLLKAQSLNPTARAASNLGSLYILEKRYREAVPILETAVELAKRDNPTEYRIWGNLGDAYSLAGAPSDKAKAAYGDAVAIAERVNAGKGSSPDVTSVLGQYYAKIGDRALALERIESSLKAAPTSASVHYQAGLVYAILGDEPRALKELKAALEGGYAVDQIKTTPELQKLRESRGFADILKYSPKNS